ncbi:hypothetical protein HKX48_005355 [Thoreauomyces humboldtii]|nr:hypothetical protein HKX48_005355 [Thoreauomyces humboldtii]
MSTPSGLDFDLIFRLHQFAYSPGVHKLNPYINVKLLKTAGDLDGPQEPIRALDDANSTNSISARCEDARLLLGSPVASASPTFVASPPSFAIDDLYPIPLQFLSLFEGDYDSCKFGGVRTEAEHENRKESYHAASPNFSSPRDQMSSPSFYDVRFDGDCSFPVGGHSDGECTPSIVSGAKRKRPAPSENPKGKENDLPPSAANGLKRAQAYATAITPRYDDTFGDDDTFFTLPPFDLDSALPTKKKAYSGAKKPFFTDITPIHLWQSDADSPTGTDSFEVYSCDLSPSSSGSQDNFPLAMRRTKSHQCDASCDYLVDNTSVSPYDI